ncbi:Flotillin-1 [Eumeta japonica]|uniref:Flotillin-1 n=1 Tax=Eumeta variegata TaxID=151549 RepID=A0A4C1SZQ8_EUMVA|nr:Flotillin-1 [Eumeta japonica]
MARTAEVKRDARIGEASPPEATIKEAIAEEHRMASRFLNDTEIAKAQLKFWYNNKKCKARKGTRSNHKRRPAEAEKYRLEKLAEANKLRIIWKKLKPNRLKYAEKLKLLLFLLKPKQKPNKWLSKAEAWREYREAAYGAAEVAVPLSQAKKITMVSSGQGEIGAAKLTGEVLQIVNKVPELVKNITGVDIARVRPNPAFI